MKPKWFWMELSYLARPGPIAPELGFIIFSGKKRKTKIGRDR